MKKRLMMLLLLGLMTISNQKVFAGYDDFTVNIPNSQGGYTAVVLKKSGEGYTGPQGEYYSQFPSVNQLQAMYGANASLPQINAPVANYVPQEPIPDTQDQPPVEAYQPSEAIYQPPPEHRHDEDYADRPHEQPTFVEAEPAQKDQNIGDVLSLFDFKKKKKSKNNQPNNQNNAPSNTSNHSSNNTSDNTQKQWSQNKTNSTPTIAPTAAPTNTPTTNQSSPSPVTPPTPTTHTTPENKAASGNYPHHDNGAGSTNNPTNQLNAAK